MNADAEEKLNPKGRGLGRGLGALFGDEEEVYPQFNAEENIPDSSRKVVGVEQLFPCPDQPRRHFDEQAIKELSLSIAEHGLLQPILVRPDKTRDGMYEIIAGERRWRASQKAQLHEVPVIIRDLDDAAAFQIALVENLQRQDLNAIEEAQGYNRLVEEFGHSHESVGEVLGKSRSHVANMIRLLQLPSSVQTMVVNGDLSAGHARALLKAEQPALMAQEVVNKKLSVRETEKLVAEYEGREIQHRSSGTKKGPGFSEKDADTLALEKEVSNQLGMNVAIDMKDAHQGKMTISFKNLDQLDDVLQRLAQRPKY
ncbi:MAG TPA: ParB/RepB/Spo0J family partition protein [Alphaproteobacteria bacterium]|nr:ParB/RepB/Spo0J family partition protein [Alphaproteobacteria bacterium]